MVSVSVSWLCYCSMVTQLLTFGGNWAKGLGGSLCIISHNSMWLDNYFKIKRWKRIGARVLSIGSCIMRKPCEAWSTSSLHTGPLSSQSLGGSKEETGGEVEGRVFFSLTKFPGGKTTTKQTLKKESVVSNHTGPHHPHPEAGASGCNG